jgi:hypothetical protein
MTNVNARAESIKPDESKVISLQDARERFEAKRCRHLNILVDQDKALVECADCTALLNPIEVIHRFATEESLLKKYRASRKEEIARLEAKRRCRCQHCGKLTRWRA